MNFIQVAGHLGADPESRFTAGGQKVTNLRLASNSKRGGKEETTWWRITIWGDRFDKMMPHLKKGSAIIVLGELVKPEIWTDKNGQAQVNLEIYAEMIRFSPFGRSDRANEGSGDTYSAAYSSDYSEGRQGFSQGGKGQGQGQGYGSNYQQEHDPAEEDLPF